MFSEEGPDPMLDSAVRQFIGRVNRTSPALVLVQKAAELIKLKPQVPCTCGNAAAYIGFKKQKTAIYIDTRGPNKFRFWKERWQKHGWTMLYCESRKLEQSTPEVIAAYLSQALEGK